MSKNSQGIIKLDVHIFWQKQTSFSKNQKKEMNLIECEKISNKIILNSILISDFTHEVLITI